MNLIKKIFNSNYTPEESPLNNYLITKKKLIFPAMFADPYYELYVYRNRYYDIMEDTIEYDVYTLHRQYHIDGAAAWKPISAARGGLVNWCEIIGVDIDIKNDEFPFTINNRPKVNVELLKCDIIRFHHSCFSNPWIKK